MGFHEWRQTHTLSVARNFYEESMNIFKPRVDYRGSGDGVTGMEFPLVNFLIAGGYYVFGYSFIVQRVCILMFSFLAITGIFLMAREMFQSIFWGFVSGWFLIFSPLFGYYSFVVLPDVPSLALMSLSLYYLIRWDKLDESRSFWAACFFLMIALLIKISAAIILPVWLYIFIKKRQTLTVKQILTSLTVFGAFLTLVACWYIYARYLSSLNLNYDFKLDTSFPYPLGIIPSVSKKVFIQWLPELYINYAQFILFLIGIVTISRSSDTNLRNLMTWFAVGVIAYMVAFYPMLEMHDYYMVTSIAFLVLLAVMGFKTLWEKALNSKKISYVLIAICILIPILGSIRALSRFEGARLTPHLESMEQHLNKIIPAKTELVIVANDDSPCIYLYHMHRKGWSATDNVSIEAFTSMIKSGAHYLVSDSRKLEQRPEIEPFLEQLSEHGDFRVFKIQPNK